MNIESGENKEKATDRNLTDFLIRHINNPCEVEVAPGVIKNIRGFYLRLAKEEIAKMTDADAIRELELKIAEYEQKD